MAKIEKSFDAVWMMRTIRDELNQRMRGMTFAEEQAYTRHRRHSRSTGPLTGAGAARQGPGENTPASEGKVVIVGAGSVVSQANG